MRSAFLAARAVACQQPGLLSSVKCGLATVTPLLATVLLTAAVFLLPAPGARHEAQASAAGGFVIPSLPAVAE